MSSTSNQLPTLASFPVQLLKSFIVVAGSDSLEKASTLLSMTQPALSLQLQKLEEELQISLFRVAGRRKLLTLDGQLLYESLKDKFELLDSALRDCLNVVAAGSHARFSIGMRKELFESICRRLHFPCQVQIRGMSTEEMLLELQKGQLDAAIIPQKPTGNHYMIRKLFVDRVCFVVHKKFLSGKSAQECFTEKFVSATPFLAYKESPPFFEDWLRHFRISSQAPRILCLCDDWNALARLVERGLGFSLMPSNIRIDTDNVAVFPLPENAVRGTQFYLVYREALKGIPAFQEVIKDLRFDGS